MSATDWDAYWRNAASAAAHKDGGPQDEVLGQFWRQFFQRLMATVTTPARMLDIACGNGAVGRFALAVSDTRGSSDGIHITGLDESVAALAEMRNRDSRLAAAAASATRLPYHDVSFQLVTSQFGAEYAGIPAFHEAARVTAATGTIAAVVHLHGGGIYLECAGNLDATRSFQQSMLLQSFAEIFRTALDVQHGRADRHAFLQADKKFSAAVATAEDALRRHGRNIADGMLFRIYTDIGHMYKRFAAYDPGEVFNWLSVTERELLAYSGRMSAMLAAAFDQETIDKVVELLRGHDFSIQLHDTLNMGPSAVPSAWVIIAQKK